MANAFVDFKFIFDPNNKFDHHRLFLVPLLTVLFSKLEPTDG